MRARGAPCWPDAPLGSGGSDGAFMRGSRGTFWPGPISVGSPAETPEAPGPTACPAEPSPTRGGTRAVGGGCCLAFWLPTGAPGVSCDAAAEAPRPRPSFGTAGLLPGTGPSPLAGLLVLGVGGTSSEEARASFSCSLSSDSFIIAAARRGRAPLAYAVRLKRTEKTYMQVETNCEGFCSARPLTRGYEHAGCEGGTARARAVGCELANPLASQILWLRNPTPYLVPPARENPGIAGPRVQGGSGRVQPSSLFFASLCNPQSSLQLTENARRFVRHRCPPGR